jgi:hypothetical protein
MTPRHLLTAFCVIAAGLARAELPTATGHSLSLDAAVISSGGASNAKSGLKLDPGGVPLGGGWSTAEQRDYKQARNKQSAIGLRVEVRNLSSIADHAELDWCFVARPVGKGEDRVFESGQQKIAIDASSTEKFELRSKALKSSVVKELHTTNGVNALGDPIPPSASVHRSGETVGGWIVRLIIDNRVAQVRASSPSLEAIGRREGQIRVLDLSNAAAAKVIRKK